MLNKAFKGESINISKKIQNRRKLDLDKAAEFSRTPYAPNRPTSNAQSEVVTVPNQLRNSVQLTALSQLTEE